MFEEELSENKKAKKLSYAKLIKKRGKIPEDAILGRVFCVVGNFFYVKPTNDNSDRLVECTLAGAIITKNESSTLVCVGDWVYFIFDKISNQSKESKGKIVKIEERTSYLIRKAVTTPDDDVIASNINKVVILVSTLYPQYNTKFIDRVLISAEYGNIEPIICVNKIDLVNIEELREDFEAYEKLDIKVVFISALNKQGIERLVELMKGYDVLMCGQSGVGKSTLLNTLAKKEIMKVREISSKTSKGRHTTSFTVMYDLKDFRLVDTPGVREFGIWNISREELPFYFHEFDNYYLECRYNPCTHTHEPDCKVKEAIENGLISQKRYESYLNIFYSLE